MQTYESYDAENHAKEREIEEKYDKLVEVEAYLEEFFTDAALEKYERTFDWWDVKDEAIRHPQYGRKCVGNMNTL